MNHSVLFKQSDQKSEYYTNKINEKSLKTYRRKTA